LIRRSPAPGHVIVQDNRTGKVSYWQKEYHQSAADGRGTSTADYIHAMYFFLRQVKAKDVLMIGCGGGTLATMLHRNGVKVTVVDLHKLSFDIARDYFHMPREIPCHVADGIAYLKKHRRRHDAIILDAFGEGGMPAKFMRPEFFKLAKSELPLYRGLAAYTSNFAFRPRAMGPVMRPSSEAVLLIKAGRCETEESSKPAM